MIDFEATDDYVILADNVDVLPKLTREERAESARRAAQARWSRPEAGA